MPEYAGFSTSLISQHGGTIPEDHVRVVTTPSLRSLHLDDFTNARDSPSVTEQHPDKTFADRAAEATVIEAYIPVYQSSQFWVCYECPGPEDEDAVAGPELKYYFFKLFVSGRCVLSWGAGEQDQWKGKTMFGLFDGGRDFEGRRIVEKRGLFFPGAGAHAGGQGFEIQVFRAKGRRSVSVRYEGLGGVTGNDGRRGGLNFTSVGKVEKGERRRMYQYALIDGKDEPWFTFRYRFEDDGDEMPIMDSTFFSTEMDDSTMAELAENDDGHGEIESSLWSELEQNTPPHLHSTLIFPRNSDEKTDTARRLSFPPRNRLFSSTNSRTPSSSPAKHQRQASASDDSLVRPHSHEARNIEYSLPARQKFIGLRKPEWTAVRTASPILGLLPDDAETVGGVGATTTHRKSSSSGSGGGLLRSVIASALRRKEEKGRG